MVTTQTDNKELILSGFHALSDKIRLQVLDLLRTRELCVCELTEILNIPQSKLSFHLKTLRETKLVNSRQQGRWTYYSLNLAQLVTLEQYLAEFRRSAILSPSPSSSPACCD